jgi:riboflavin kinase/FMN adenylyltransferase
MHWQIGDAPLDGPPLASAIGNFDGVHRGHQKLVMAACEAAKRDGLMPAIITFNPHPRDFFRQEAAPFRLVDNAEKDRLLSGLHVERIIHVSFDDALRRTDAEDFVSSVLPAIGVRQLFAGMLGRNWAVTGTVITGDQRGRTIGFPTANIALENLQHPAFGVYAVEIDLDDGQTAPRRLAGGVANIGVRPTFEKRGVLCEAHLFDGNYELYGQRLLVRLKAFLRPEQRFAGVDELLAQIAADAEQARLILSDLTLRQSG